MYPHIFVPLLNMLLYLLVDLGLTPKIPTGFSWGMTLGLLLVLEIVHFISVPIFLKSGNKTWIITENNYRLEK
jgi:hypothetical protein